MTEGNYWTGLTEGRVARRRLLRGVFVGSAGIAAAALVGCGQKKEAAAPEAAPAAEAPAVVEETGTAATTTATTTTTTTTTTETAPATSTATN